MQTKINAIQRYMQLLCILVNRIIVEWQLCLKMFRSFKCNVFNLISIEN